MRRIEFENGEYIEIKKGEDIFKALYRKFCWDCEKAPYCHMACSEFSDSCDYIEEVTRILEEYEND